MNSQPPDRCKTQLGPICVRIDCPYPPLPPSHDWCMVENCPPLSFGRHVGLFKLSSEHCFVCTQNRCHMNLRSIWLVLTQHHHLHRHQLPLHKNLMKKSMLTLVRPSLCLILVRFCCLVSQLSFELPQSSLSSLSLASFHTDQPPTWLS
jgi:hypothetical protein